MSGAATVAVLVFAACWLGASPARDARAGASGESSGWGPPEASRPAGRFRTRYRSVSTGVEEVDVAEVLDLLALALTAGVAVDEALVRVAEAVGGQRGGELRSVATAQAWGIEEERAWNEVPEHWRSARQAIALARRAGVPPTALLRAAASDERRDRQSRAELAAARLSVHLVLPVGLLFLPAFVLTTVVPIVLALAAGVLRTSPT